MTGSGAASGAGGNSASTGGAGANGGSPSTGGTGGEVTIPVTCTPPASQTAEVYTGSFDGSSCSSAIDPPRVGFWYATNDGTGGLQVPAPGEPHLGVLGGRRGADDCAMRSRGSGFTDWGAIFGFNFSVSQAGPCVYDATPYQGVVVYLQGTTSGGVGGDNMIRVNVQALPTMTTTEGGDCSTICDDHYGRFCALASSYTVCDLPFGSILPEGWGVGQGAFDRTRLRGIQIKATGASWDVTVDDIIFY
jgi:hypothetical protein